jgi:hypothetical protein
LCLSCIAFHRTREAEQARVNSRQQRIHPGPEARAAHHGCQVQLAHGLAQLLLLLLLLLLLVLRLLLLNLAVGPTRSRCRIPSGACPLCLAKLCLAKLCHNCQHREKSVGVTPRLHSEGAAQSTHSLTRRGSACTNAPPPHTHTRTNRCRPAVRKWGSSTRSPRGRPSSGPCAASPSTALAAPQQPAAGLASVRRPAHACVRAHMASDCMRARLWRLTAAACPACAGGCSRGQLHTTSTQARRSRTCRQLMACCLKCLQGPPPAASHSVRGSAAQHTSMAHTQVEHMRAWSFNTHLSLCPPCRVNLPRADRFLSTIKGEQSSTAGGLTLVKPLQCLGRQPGLQLLQRARQLRPTAAAAAGGGRALRYRCCRAAPPRVCRCSRLRC